MITPTRGVIEGSGRQSRVGALLQGRRDGPGRFAQLTVLLVVVGEPVEDEDRLALRRAVLEHDDAEPAHREIRVVRRDLVQERPHPVDVAGMVARQPLERDQSRAAGGRGLVLQPPPDELELLPEAELRDRSVGLRPDPVVGTAGRVLELLVPLLAQRREGLLVAGGGELVGASRSLGQVHEIEEAGRAPGPTYRADGRTSRFSFFCSRMCADQPAVREQANIAGASSGGIPATSSTTADQNSTLVSSGRSGDFFRSASSAAASSLSATS